MSALHADCDFDQILIAGRGFVQPPFLPVGLEPRRQRSGPLPLLPSWSRVDHDFGGALRELQEAVKAVSRGRPPKVPIQEAEDQISRFDPNRLTPGVWDLYERTLPYVRGSV